MQVGEPAPRNRHTRKGVPHGPLKIESCAPAHHGYTNQSVSHDGLMHLVFRVAKPLPCGEVDFNAFSRARDSSCSSRDWV